jgi:pyridoxal phosphate enzyme (YggS family)
MLLSERYSSVKERIAQAAKASSRGVADINLIVVTKNHPAQMVLDLIALGQRHFGENRDQEASKKASDVFQSGGVANWHFVGQLQTNKVKSVVSYASTIHSIDRLSLVAELSKQLEKQNRKVDGFIELNLTQDENRGGVSEQNLEQLVTAVLAQERINLLGVMAVAGLGEDPRREFERAVGLSQKVRQIAPSASALSMGMSEDFEVAIEMGATHIRVGSAITGPRDNSA